MQISKQLMLVILVFLLITPSSVYSLTIKIEAEDFTEYHDIALDSIRAAPAPGCSEGFILVGLDYNDEWTLYPFDLPVFGYFQVFMVYRGDYGVPYHLKITFYPEIFGEPQTVDFNFYGQGYG
ncbi:MAG: hypothetical protein KAX38_04220 [Candidatus Krumholzibacteria bacterium]|nr:hypothetical protein [Candidatus Krumholzibacteria bacterium]